MNASTMTLSLFNDTATATLLRDADNRWRWYDTTNENESGVDTEISGDTAIEALERLCATQGASNIDGDLSDHLSAAASLDAATT